MREEREGFRFSIDSERRDDTLEVTRVLEVRGLHLEADEVPACLRRTKELEDEEGRPVRLRRRRG